MIRTPVFNDTNSTCGDLFPDPVVQKNDAIGNVLLQAVASKRTLPQLAGNDRRNLLFLKPTEKSFYLQAKDAGILRLEIKRLFRWLKEKQVTAIVTGELGQGSFTRHGLEEYISD